ncbi:MAG: glycosyltransferase family 4 protein [Chloroflexi bacterium]|nr:glycosyltransferase family 4 protein [Chloroflexota bacterium]
MYFTRDYTPHDYRFLSSLAQTEHEVYYLRLERRGHQQEDRALPPGIHIVRWAGGHSRARLIDYPRLLASLRRVLKRVKPDILHAGPIQTVSFLAALSGLQPLVSMSWGSDLLLDADRNKLNMWLTRYVFKRSAVLISDCDTVRHKAVSFGFRDERIVTFPWGVDLKHFSPGREDGLRERAGWEGAFVLLHTRSWEPVYGVDVVAQAFTRAARQIPELRLFLLGNGSLSQKIWRILELDMVQGRVRFAGQVGRKELSRYFRTADLYVSASHSDGSSVSLMEAMASGVPALVSDIPGNREWVTPDQNGWLFPDGDANALEHSILQAFEQREKLAEMGRAARKQAEYRADWSKNFKQLLHAYELAMA